MDKGNIKQYIYYVIIGIVSFLALAFLPMLGSTVGMGFNYPETVAARVVWWTTKAIMAVINVLIFYSFMQQAKLNVKDDEKYKEGLKLLNLIKIKKYVPRSPEKWSAIQYSVKGTTIFITTALSTIALTQAILTFDYVSLLTYLFTIIMGLVFGVLQMKKAELYWTTEFYDYAITEVSKNDCSGQQTVPQSRGTSSQESE